MQAQRTSSPEISLTCAALKCFDPPRVQRGVGLEGRGPINLIGPLNLGQSGWRGSGWGGGRPPKAQLELTEGRSDGERPRFTPKTGDFWLPMIVKHHFPLHFLVWVAPFDPGYAYLPNLRSPHHQHTLT